MTFITAAELLSLKPVYDEGKDTIRTYKATPTIQLKRQVAGTGVYVVVETFTPVKIELADRMEQQGGFNTGLVNQTQTGSFEVDASIGIERDDRFQWDGTPCTVTLVKPADTIFGYRTVEFEFLGGS